MVATAAVATINRVGGMYARRMSRGLRSGGRKGGLKDWF